MGEYMIALAHELRAAGLGTFPCSHKKKPAIPKTTGWRDWAEKSPDLLPHPTGIVGVPVPEGIVVIDLDTYKGVTREAVELALGVSLEWDDALIQHTLNGGQHYAFAVDWPVRFGSNMAGIKGLDTRSHG